MSRHAKKEGGPESVVPPSSANDPSEVGAILIHLGREIRLPLDSLKEGIARILAEPADGITEVERGQATVMMGVCDDLDRLTRECLGIPEG